MYLDEQENHSCAIQEKTNNTTEPTEDDYHVIINTINVTGLLVGIRVDDERPCGISPSSPGSIPASADEYSLKEIGSPWTQVENHEGLLKVPVAP